MNRLDVRKLVLSLGALCSLAAVTAFGVAPSSDADLPAPAVFIEPVALSTQIIEPASALVQTERVRRGETLASLFSRLGLDDPEVISLVPRHAAARQLLELRAGRVVSAERSPEGKLQRFTYRLGEPATGTLGKRLVIERVAGQLMAFTENIPSTRATETRSAEVVTNLVAALDAADIPDTVLTRMADVFGGQVNLAQALKGDRLRVVYETLQETGSLESPVLSRILAVQFSTASQTHEALWFGNGQRGEYYTFAGHSLNRSFLASPLEVTRVSSGYSDARFHPSLKSWQAHKGVDLTAPVGSRVRSVADGVVDFVGPKGGYGNMVVIKHSAQQSTLYAHLNEFADGLRPGVRVLQGETIGTVGMTGWTTGPHLHFEFLVNGVHVDPMAAIAGLPVRTLNAAERVRLQSQARAYIEKFELLDTRFAARFE